jgi:hypothetical protein
LNFRAEQLTAGFHGDPAFVENGGPAQHRAADRAAKPASRVGAEAMFLKQARGIDHILAVQVYQRQVGIIAGRDSALIP